MSEGEKNEKNAEVTSIPGHSYDGIEELDNSLPKWWLNLFYLTIVFAIGYFGYYELGDGPSLLKEYERQKTATELTALVKPKNVPSASESELRAGLKDPTRIQAGKGVFRNRCASCHGEQGQGIIGPNLTDNYWLHGGKMTEIFQTVTNGVPEKGMPPWGPVLSPEEVRSVVTYVKSIGGSNPPNPKAPQGERVSE